MFQLLLTRFLLPLTASLLLQPATGPMERAKDVSKMLDLGSAILTNTIMGMFIIKVTTMDTMNILFIELEAEFSLLVC